ncbi:SDR family NAD(P)-dependent oxidoreductase [Chitinophaga solisilvae]|uniref:SDR family NAD(P)-dependent oxidoreductase n=1 Tax=Chitinophaga solisilvae TaxID=1233460 RepID=UPI001371B1EF|nr:SDR family oxidoreductase [Chitinophaga solisilvae]
MSLQIDLTGKTAIVTGAASGIGAGIYHALLQAGATVYGADITGSGDIQPVDVTDDAQVQSFVASIAQQHPQIDILISCAGSNVFTGAATTTPEEWEQNMQLNLRSHWQLARCCRPWLQQSGNGVIIIITSNHAYRTIPGCFPYNVAKTALTGLVQSLAAEWGPQIRTVGIAPGFIDTPGNQTWFNSFPDPTAERQRTINLHPVRKLGTPAEIGAWCAFLSSDYASFASGVTYLIDGGRSALMQDA